MIIYLPKPHFQQPYLLPTEILYPLIVIAISLFIFFRTKELYDLSKHKGIYFFRQTFLFFALAYFFRFLPVFFRLTDFDLAFVHFRLIFSLGLYLFGFASTMALLSLARSLTWKDLSSTFLAKSYPYYILAVLLPLTLFSSLQNFLYSQLGLLVLVVTLSYLYHKKTDKGKKYFMYYNYLLLAFLWTLNIAAITLPPFLLELKLILYALSLLLFVLMLYRVVVKTKVR